MKYAIRRSDFVKYVLLNENGAFHFATSLDDATHFATISDAIDAIRKQAQMVTSVALVRNWVTIVGVEEIQSPKYTEVSL